ncbi:MAG: CPBP family intramembrane glutamic endopeptidase [Bacteroidota bacterium]
MTFNFTNPNAWFDRIIAKTTVIASPYLVLFALLADVIVTAIFSFILFPENTSGPVFETSVPDFLLIVIAAPIIETAIVQLWIIKTVLKYSRNNRLLAVLISAILFGLAHHYSIAYVLKATLAGTIYAMLWFSIAGKQKNPFWYVVLTHSMYNSIGFIINAYT